MESRKEMQQTLEERNEDVKKSRHEYRLQLLLAKPEEKGKLRRARKNLVARSWYRTHRKQEAEKHQERRQRTCCPSKKLGREVAPQDRFVTLWITTCKECGRRTQGKFGANKQGRVGVFFRGQWFKEIDPSRGTATTFQGQDISLTAV